VTTAPSSSKPVGEPIYETPAQAGAATDDFYAASGFEYTDDKVRDLLRIYLPNPPTAGKVLDLCCGDGIWSKGIKALNPKLELHGIDISSGGITKARSLVPENAANFVVGDAEGPLPWPDGTFDLVFARGPGLYNQHCMDRPATIAVIEAWHQLLKPAKGRFLSLFYSSPELVGTYTNPLKAALPYNRAPRLTPAVDFTGGKYHHDMASFLTPFRNANNVAIVEYRFLRNTHMLETRLRTAHT